MLINSTIHTTTCAIEYEIVSSSQTPTMQHIVK